MTTLDNLQIIQWQANASKKDYLEFMVPWWELQIGVSVAQLIRLVSSGDSSIRSATLLTMFPGGVEERLVQDFRLHPKGRTKMIALAVQGVDETSSRKEELINASECRLRYRNAAPALAARLLKSRPQTFASPSCRILLAAAREGGGPQGCNSDLRAELGEDQGEVRRVPGLADVAAERQGQYSLPSMTCKR